MEFTKGMGNVVPVSTAPLQMKTPTIAVRPVNNTAVATTTSTRPGVDLNKVQQGVNIAQDIVSIFRPKSSAPAVSAGNNAPPPAAATQKKGINWLTVALVGSGLALGTFAVVRYASKKKKKALNGLGELNTAKTAKKRVAQRKAVMAKLEDKGKLLPKNTVGKRAKPRKKAKSVRYKKLKL